MSIRIREIDHVVLYASDLDASLAFWCGAMGCEEERRVESIGLVQLRAGSSLVDLLDAASSDRPTPPGDDADDGRNMDHVCFRIHPWDEDAIRAHLERHGVTAGETKMRYGAEGNGPSIYLHDPDGNLVELKGPPAE